MIDLLKLDLPFKSEWLLVSPTADHRSGVYIDLEQIAKNSGLKLSATTVEYEIDGDLTVSGLSHPYESLPSHFGSLAMKIHQGGSNRLPGVELKASPAKLLQGHNVFGPTSIELCSGELLSTLALACPELVEMLDIPNATLEWMDVTYSAKVSKEEQRKQVISALKNVRSGQTKQSRMNRDYETTAEWNTGSRHRALKAYLKGPEFQRQLAENLKKLQKQPKNESLRRCVEVMSNAALQLYASQCVRFEARLKQRALTKHGVPFKLFDAIQYQKDYEKDGRCLIADLWKAAFKELFDALGEQPMKVYTDDDIRDALYTSYQRLTPKGNVSYAKAQRIHGFYRRLINEGYDTVYRSMSRETFRRHLTDLIAVGLTKAQLQNLSGDASNVVPLIQVINIDFGQQLPEWYVEPISTMDRMATAAQPTEVVTIERDELGAPKVTRTFIDPIPPVPGAMPPRSYPSSPGHRLRAVS
ncbi:DNA replication protein [Aeromonas jandaei]|uniref:phage/plasmid replication protein, II/X family n=1 Tax=Aeromonas TaxID=642 RepID=UPI001119A3BA|nr:phage/plasmid replication protein, II/X family [Aeromonas veronii]MBM0490507.1 DNA replication protein [Aeromonas jandaei]MBM0569144.1 DNA replication protein [Aeromonas jandaei]MBM0569155.1 DNA replication protein [Aeromonas jandaei]TNI70043.1 DNA replication protein [Aeromonas veronii]WIJ41327.1 phage/plasmid replication protein, II/X family [Aeromonas veronii]